MKKIIILSIFFLSFVVFPAVSAQAVNIVDGDLIKTSDNPDVYIVKIKGSKKFKRLILNPDIFNSYGHLKWSDIKIVSQGEVDQFKLSKLVIEVNSDGSVADPKVYKISSSAGSDAGERRWLNLTASEFEQAGYDWDSIYHTNHIEASPSFYSTKTELRFSDIENINSKATQPDALVVKSITPNQIKNNVNSIIIINGSGFKLGALVLIGGQSTEVTYISESSLSVKINSGFAGGVYDVKIINPENDIVISKSPLVVISYGNSTAESATNISNTDLQISSVSVTPSTMSAKIEWETNNPTDSKLFLSGGGFSSNIFTSLSGVSKHHSVEVMGLIPNIDYTYNIEAVFNLSASKDHKGSFKMPNSSFSIDTTDWTVTTNGEPYLIDALTVSADNMDLRKKLYPTNFKLGDTKFQFRECPGLESLFQEYSSVSYPYVCPSRYIKTPEEYQNVNVMGYSVASKDWMGRDWYALTIPFDSSVAFAYFPEGTKLEFIKAVGTLSGNIVTVYGQ